MGGKHGVIGLDEKWRKGGSRTRGIHGVDCVMPSVRTVPRDRCITMLAMLAEGKLSPRSCSRPERMLHKSGTVGILTKYTALNRVGKLRVVVQADYLLPVEQRLVPYYWSRMYHKRGGRDRLEVRSPFALYELLFRYQRRPSIKRAMPQDAITTANVADCRTVAVRSSLVQSDSRFPACMLIDKASDFGKSVLGPLTNLPVLQLLAGVFVDGFCWRLCLRPICSCNSFGRMAQILATL